MIPPPPLVRNTTQKKKCTRLPPPLFHLINCLQRNVGLLFIEKKYVYVSSYIHTDTYIHTYFNQIIICSALSYVEKKTPPFFSPCQIKMMPSPYVVPKQKEEGSSPLLQIHTPVARVETWLLGGYTHTWPKGAGSYLCTYIHSTIHAQWLYMKGFSFIHPSLPPSVSHQSEAISVSLRFVFSNSFYPCETGEPRQTPRGHPPAPPPSEAKKNNYRKKIESFW